MTGWNTYYSLKITALQRPTLWDMSHHLRPVFSLFSQIPDHTETQDPQPLEELMPQNKRAHPDLIGIREDISFPEFLVCGTPACCF